MFSKPVLLHLISIALGMLLAFIGASSGNTQSIQSMPGWVGSSIYKYTPLNMSEIHCVAMWSSAQIIRREEAHVYMRLSCACMCMCQGNQSTRYLTGQAYGKSRHDLRALSCIFKVSEKLSWIYVNMPHMQTHHSVLVQGLFVQS